MTSSDSPEKSWKGTFDIAVFILRKASNCGFANVILNGSEGSALDVIAAKGKNRSFILFRMTNYEKRNFIPR